MPTVDVIVPLRPGCRDQFPVRGGANVAVRNIECADGNLTLLWRAAYLGSSADIVLFKHDDFWIRNWDSLTIHWPLLLRYPVLGVAGTRYYSPAEAAWWNQVRTRPQPGPGINRGMVAHFRPGQDPTTTEPGGYAPLFYGPPGPVAILDGCCVAVRRRMWQAGAERFMPEAIAEWWDLTFSRHFYDVAFCFNATRAYRDAYLGPACYAVVADVCSMSGNLVDAEWESAARRFQQDYAHHGPIWV